MRERNHIFYTVILFLFFWFCYHSGGVERLLSYESQILEVLYESQIYFTKI